MRVIIVGLGVQGAKRRLAAGKDLVATVDTVNPEAEYQHIADVPLQDYDAALLCLPDAPKVEVIRYLLENGKHVLVEKPFWAADDAEIQQLDQLAKQKRVVCYTAYNHRFEPHFVRMREVIASQQLGQLYYCRLFYGNGTVRLFRDSPWRDKQSGVIADLGSHLLDTMDFWFGFRRGDYQLMAADRFENKSPDHAIITHPHTIPTLHLEMSLLSWRNDFHCDLYAEKGSAHIRSLCKWGPSEFVLRQRILPSGRPTEQVETLVKPDPTWDLEYAHFKQRVQNNMPNDLEKDLWLNRELRTLGEAASLREAIKTPG